MFEVSSLSINLNIKVEPKSPKGMLVVSMHRIDMGKREPCVCLFSYSKRNSKSVLLCFMYPVSVEQDFLQITSIDMIGHLNFAINSTRVTDLDVQFLGFGHVINLNKMKNMLDLLIYFACYTGTIKSDRISSYFLCPNYNRIFLCRIRREKRLFTIPVHGVCIQCPFYFIFLRL